MSTSRRDFLQRAAGSSALLGTLPLSLHAFTTALDPLTPSSEEFDLTWINRLTTKHRAVFDVPEVDSGYGVWRATIWMRQYNQFLGVEPSAMTAVVVLRHNGIALAMQQEYWDKYEVGKEKQVRHPVTLQPTDRNPVLLSSTRGEIPDAFDDVQLDRFIGRGGIALACNLAFDDCVGVITARDKVSAEEARRRALALLVPGVTLQPSGVFAALRAQEAGCTYLRAS